MLSVTTMKTLLRLIDSKIGTFEIYDNDDRRELANLRDCRAQLLTLAGEVIGKAPAVRQQSPGSTVAA